MKIRLSALLFSVSVAAFSPVMAQNAPAKDYTILRIGNEEVKNSEVMDIWKGLFSNGAAPDFNSFDENVRQNVLRGLVSERLIYQEALKTGTDKSDDVKKRVAAIEKQVVMQSFMEQKANSLVTEEQLKAAYTKKINGSKGQEEVRARHILVASEAEAKKISDQIKGGEDFEKIAKARSTDKGSGANGGELGWFTKDKMVPEFADAAFKLKKGEVSAPIQSAFGWHVIQVEDRRPLQIASYEEMKESLRKELSNEAMQTYMEGLLKSASVKYYGADGKEKSFSAIVPSAGKPDAKPADAKPASK